MIVEIEHRLARQSMRVEPSTITRRPLTLRMLVTTMIVVACPSTTKETATTRLAEHRVVRLIAMLLVSTHPLCLASNNTMASPT
jgi:hypothetical protein